MKRSGVGRSKSRTITATKWVEAAGRRFGAALGKPAGRKDFLDLDPGGSTVEAATDPRVEKDTRCTVNGATSLEYED